MVQSSLFKIDIKTAIKTYCQNQHYHDMRLSDNEIAQLAWYVGDHVVTPSASEQDIIGSLHFEIKRSLARCYSFELILRGDEVAYQAFIQAQNKNTQLSFDTFKQLSEEANQLNEDIKTVIRASCFLTISEKAKNVLKEKDIVLSNDSEEFLSQLAAVLIQHNSLFPITKNFAAEQLNLLPKLFWPNMHLRHMLYTEGGDNMTKTFSDGLLNKTFNQQDFSIWKWRWLTNLFGFLSGPAAKYYDAETNLLTSTVIHELEKVLTQPNYSYLDNYLLKRAEMAGFHQDALKLTTSEQQLLGHIAAYYNITSILTPDKGAALYAAYKAFKEECHDAETLAKNYESHRHDMSAVTPTYVPAIINNAYRILKDRLSKDSCYVSDQPKLEFDALKLSSLFMLQTLNTLYALPRDKRISCMNFADNKNLSSILDEWMLNHHAYRFELNENAELQAQKVPSLNFSFAR